jgi:hypothetical protein
MSVKLICVGKLDEVTLYVPPSTYPFVALVAAPNIPMAVGNGLSTMCKKLLMLLLPPVLAVLTMNAPTYSPAGTIEFMFNVKILRPYMLAVNKLLPALDEVNVPYAYDTLAVPLFQKVNPTELVHQVFMIEELAGSEF